VSKNKHLAISDTENAAFQVTSYSMDIEGIYPKKDSSIGEHVVCMRMHHLLHLD
jgi:hypothetical protein